MRCKTMKNNRNIPNFLDGFLTVYRDENQLNNFGAKVNNRSLMGLELMLELAYAEMFKRAQDYELAVASNSDLTLKVKTHLVKGILSTDKVVIDNVMYSIVYLDEDRINKVMYFYLEEDGELDE